MLIKSRMGISTDGFVTPDHVTAGLRGPADLTPA